jgi:signal transduction histidine kinase
MLVGSSEMGLLMREKDWSATPIGPMAGWPQSLRTAVNICLASRFPMLLWWGPELVMLYNDAYRPILGTTKHPQALGQRGHECWPEIWDVIGPMLQGVMATGTATWSDDQLLLLDRNGYVEECYFTFSYSPIHDEAGQVGGVFTAVTETTGRVLGERRLRVLRDLGTTTAQVRTVKDACALTERVLARHAAALPFALLYLLDADGKHARLACQAGLAPETPANPLVVDLEDATSCHTVWPLAYVVRTGQMALVQGLSSRFGPLIGPAYPQPQRALVLPVAQAGQERPAGLLIAGINPQRALDDEYRGFFELVAGQVATALANARAYEEERKRAEALAEIDRAKTTFFSNVSHEFRTPLTLLLGPLEDALAESSDALSLGQRERIDLARRSALRLLKLVNTLLDFSRIEAGRVEAVYAPTDLASLTAELASMFRSAVERAGLRLEIDCPPLPEPVYVDQEMWEKIVLNLLSNALKFTFEGRILVQMRPADRAVVLTVEDSGSGIPAEQMPHLFERFHRARPTYARTHGGTGIGLALVQELVRLHGGTIQVASEVDRGTTFTITLPLGTAHLPADRLQAPRTLRSTALGAEPYVEEALRWLPAHTGQETTLGVSAGLSDALEGAASARVSAGNSAPGSERQARQRILLVDDNADMRAYLERLLGERWEVIAVADGTAALEAARGQRPDLVLSDVMMPRLDGFQLLRALRADPATAAVPIVLLSARAGEEAITEGLQAGADDYLVKPFSGRELLARIGAHLDMARLQEEAVRQMSEFLGLAGHELRTPLTGLRGQLQLARRRLERLRAEPPETSEDWLTKIEPLQAALDKGEQQTRRLNRLIGDLLEVSRIQAEKLDLHMDSGDLVSIVREATEEQQLAWPNRTITLALPARSVLVLADGDRIRQVVTNYLTNALKYSPSDRPVAVALQLESQQALVLVRDEGPGIPLEEQPHIWDRFHRVKAIPVRSGGGVGLGLGLYISKTIIEGHGGQVGVESTPGQGAAFWFRLPLVQEAGGNNTAYGPSASKPA